MKPVTIDGKTYKTIAECMDKTGFSYKKVSKILKNETEKNIDIPVKGKYSCFYRKKTYNFNLIEECVEFLKNHKIKKYLNDYDGLLKFFNAKDKRKYTRKNKIKFTFEGKDYEFETISQIRKKTRLCFKTISKIIKGEPIKEFYRIKAKFCLEQASDEKA